MPKSKPKKPTVIVLRSKNPAEIVVKPKKKAAIVVQPKKPDAIVVQPIIMPVKEDLVKDSTKKEEEEFENPWSIKSIYEFQYFNCPSCAFKRQSKQEFINHAYEVHPESIDYLQEIKDGSLSGTICPWNTIQIDPKVTGKVIKRNPNLTTKASSTISNLKEIVLVYPNKEYICEDDTTEQIYDESDYVPIESVTEPIDLQEANEPIDIKENLSEDVKEAWDAIPENNQNQCKLCKKKFSTPHEVKRHIARIHDQVRICCNFQGCEKKFSDQYSFDKHMKNAHDVDVNKCKICDETLSGRLQLKLHMKKVHDEKPIKDKKCDKCPRVFDRSQDLNRHIAMVHESTRQHVCEKCGKCYSMRNKLMTHMKIVHEGTTRVTCEKCGKMFNQAAALQKHIKESSINYVVKNQCFRISGLLDF